MPRAFAFTKSSLADETSNYPSAHVMDQSPMVPPCEPTPQWWRGDTGLGTVILQPKAVALFARIAGMRSKDEPLLKRPNKRRGLEAERPTAADEGS